nr:RNA-directed DNA polymerase, eukaryota [Tanacetum cinerariifolium]
MGSYRSKEDDVARISMSIYVTNFPDSFSAKDLFHLCKQYGHVMDSFIPIKRSENGKRFGFVRFINVFNKERLVNNLCTVWSGRFKLQANIARFQRTPVNGNMNFRKDKGGFMGKNSHMNKKDNGNYVAKEPTGSNNTYVQVVKGDVKTGGREGDVKTGGRETELIPVVFLDDECLMSNDFSMSLLGRVKEFASLANLKVALCNEGFVNIKIKYIGELWVLLEFVTRESIKLYRDNVSFGSWFSQIIEASRYFVTNGRIAWVEVEGVPFKLWSHNTFKRIANRWGKLLDVDDQEETCYHSKRLCIYTKSGRNILESFKIIHRGKAHWIRACETLGWVPDFADESDDEDQEDDMSNDGGAKEHIPSEGDVDDQENKSEDPFQIYKLLHKNNKVDRNAGATVKVERVNTIYEANEGSSGIRVNEISKANNAESGQVMRYNMEGCKSNMADIIGSQGVDERYLSDHRPILLRDAHVDYGPTLFRFFRYWLEMEGFAKIVEDGWRDSPCDRSNALRNLLGKLKHLKNDIRVWNKSKGNSNRDAKAQLKLELEGVMSDGVWVDNPIKVKKEFRDHFSKRFCKPGLQNVNIQMTFSNQIFVDQKRDLEGKVTNDEIKKAVWDCGTDKAPGPDGFTFGFYRKFWYLIDNDVCDAVRFFFKNDNIPNGCNSSFIALIPKIPNANMVKDFRPISLVGSVYKIIAKILANRLVGVLGDIVSEVQSAFIAGRQILDGPFILNEVLQMIQACLKSSRGSVIINGSPTEEFQFGKGIKQGDPLSPFLFLLIIESLHLSFQRVLDAGLFQGLQLGNINSLVNIFECFNMASGLKINMRKSKIMGVHVTRDKVDKAAMKLGCLVPKAPFLYLGSMVGGAMSRSKSWYEVVDRVKKRLSKWKLKTLSIGGRLTLFKFVLGSIPIFHMSMHRVPMGVLRTLESLRSHFFNGYDPNSRKASWVKWKMVLASKDKGGLGVSSLYALNMGILFKWLWRFYSKDSSLWAKVIMAIHGSDGKVEASMKAESFKSITVGRKLAQSSLIDSFRRSPRGGTKQQQYNDLEDMVTATILALMSDRLVWSLESSGEFTVASVRKLIDDKWLLGTDNKTRWIKYVPIKINVHDWKVMSDSIPTIFNISRRGISIDSLSCVLCDNGVKTSNHLFFSCCFVRQVFRLIMRWWDVLEAEFKSYAGWLDWLVNLRF